MAAAGEQFVVVTGLDQLAVVEQRIWSASATVENRCDTTTVTAPGPGSQLAGTWTPIAPCASSQSALFSGATACAAEGDVCQVDGRRKVAYSANGAFRFMTVNGTAKCTATAFGSDPPARLREVLPRAAGRSGGRVGVVRDEGSACLVAGTQAFGAKGSYSTAKSGGTANRGLGTFGVDPLYEVVKACYLVS